MRNHQATGGSPKQSEGMHHQFRPESMQQFGQHLSSKLIALGILYFMIHAALAAGKPAASVRFPDDSSVVDVKKECGAKGDGVADDTDALQKGIEASCRGSGKQSKVLFIPNGTYRVTRTLVVKSAVGPWVYGESRDGVIIRLADGVTDTNCTAVLRTHPHEKGKTSADWFMRNIRNLTR